MPHVRPRQVSGHFTRKPERQKAMRIRIRKYKRRKYTRTAKYIHWTSRANISHFHKRATSLLPPHSFDLRCLPLWMDCVFWDHRVHKRYCGLQFCMSSYLVTWTSCNLANWRDCNDPHFWWYIVLPKKVEGIQLNIYIYFLCIKLKELKLLRSSFNSWECVNLNRSIKGRFRLTILWWKTHLISPIGSIVTWLMPTWDIIYLCEPWPRPFWPWLNE